MLVNLSDRIFIWIRKSVYYHRNGVTYATKATSFKEIKTMEDDANGNTLASNPAEDLNHNLTSSLVDAKPELVTEKIKEDQPIPKIIPSGYKSIGSNLKAWYNKKYLGGYRQKISLIEYFNAETQTPTPQEARNQKVIIAH